MSRSLDVVCLSGDEYDKMCGDLDLLRASVTSLSKQVQYERAARDLLTKPIYDVKKLEPPPTMTAPIGAAEEVLLRQLEDKRNEAAALRAEVERLRVDAERYRWLRGDACPDHSPRWTQWEVRCWRAPFWTSDLRRRDLDAAIDAAMLAAAPAKEQE